ncbi:OsmC family protein [Rhizomicrobium electricum]|jgi:uncharacterized OsmC-like protein|uniref:OsmC family peroxiredoxin n=1 Tax=Rhizomicrobium electricum TaxID=480070 RepID=A0ABP3QFD8_9PROT|nr:OsmC family protein [Rhizomicrobium electricum]NIJ50631.1 putative OsmC-like protein [Rhizomicrobium electricum]
MYTAIVENNGSQQYRATSRGYEFVMGQSGANPIETLLAGLCACVSHHVRDRLIEKKIAFSKFAVKADAELVADGLSIARIVLAIEVRGAVVTAAQGDDLIEQSRQCPLYGTLVKGTVIEIGCKSVSP